MYSSLHLVLWSLCSFVLYKLISFIATEIRYRRKERELGCKRAPSIPSKDPLGISNILAILKADKEFRFPQLIKERTEKSWEAAGFQANTTYQNLLGSGEFFTVDPKNIQALLATQFKDFGLGAMRNKNFYPLLGWGIFTTDGKQWEHSRALLRPQFVREQVSDLDLEERHVQNMMKALPTRADGWTDVIDIQALFFRLTIDSATEFLFGQSVDSQLVNLPGYLASKSPIDVSEKDFAFAFDKAQACISNASRFGNFYWVAHNKEFKEYCRQCHVFIDYYVKLAQTKQRSPVEKDASEKQRYVFLEALAESTQDPIELRSQLISILLAGRDTTASLLSYVFMFLDQHPRVFAKLRAAILEDFGTYANPKEITFSKMKSCSYLQWCLNETLRLNPVVPIDGRSAIVDTTLPTGGGPDGRSPVLVRKGQQVNYSVYVMHRRKDLWGPDADEFKPERWEGRRSGFEYLPFNGGPRICIGQQFALTEAGYVTVRLLQRFSEIQGVGNTWLPIEQGGYGEVRQRLTLTSCPADGVKIRLREATE